MQVRSNQQWRGGGGAEKFIRSWIDMVSIFTFEGWEGAENLTRSWIDMISICRLGWGARGGGGAE